MHWIAELSINEDKQSEFEKLANEMMSDTVRRSEPATRNYEWFLAEGGNKCVIIETYDSSNTGLVHVRGEGINKIFPEILKIAKNITRFEICDKPSEELVREIAYDYLSVYRFINGF
ncbi:MAG: antibiotic biosynthesis monooxygenase [Thermoproteota archaeon]|nr:antibiotic biosynthesis monooxygenase [Thermoproteota archaeon]